MGLFHKNPNEAYFAGGSKNVMESIQRNNDTGTLIYLDPRQDFNTNSVITVAPNEQVIFINNGEIYGVLPSGRHEVKTDNYPVLSRIRNMLTGGISTFTCQVCHVQTNEQMVKWGTQNPIEIQDYFLGGGQIGVPTKIRGYATFRVRFNIVDDVEACVKTYMSLMGDQRTFTVGDLSVLFQDQISEKIASIVGKTLEGRSKSQSINAISSQLEDFSIELKPFFDSTFADYGLELVNFSFGALSIDETKLRQKYLDRLIATSHAGSYDKAVAQEITKDVATNPGEGNMAGIGAGLGLAVAMGNTFGNMATATFNNPQQSSHDYNSLPDPMESLKKVKQMLVEGYITQETYDSKVKEIMSRL